MRPAVWGPYFWHTIHLAALGYPQHPTADERAAYRDFFMRIRHILPCRKCSANFARHMEELPIYDQLENRDALFAWTVAFHNLVNTEHNKPTWTVKKALDFYTNLPAGGVSVTSSSSVSANGTSDPVLPSAAAFVPRKAVFVLIGINVCAILLVLVLMGIMLRSRLSKSKGR